MIFTKHLTIRKFTIEDLLMYFENSWDELIKKYDPYRFYADENKARKDLELYISNYSAKKSPYDFPYYLAVVKTDINKLIGLIGIGGLDISETERGYELEYLIRKDYRGFGYGTEALKAFAPWCKKEFGIDKIYAMVHQENIASYKALLNAGFTIFEGAIKNKKPQRNAYVF